MHPSGFHILVAYADKITMMNVLSKQLKEAYSVQMKACKEVRFSNGGHLFAAGGLN
jgi:cilia- and flagella-associated protein 57